MFHLQGLWTSLCSMGMQNSLWGRKLWCFWKFCALFLILLFSLWSSRNVNHVSGFISSHFSWMKMAFCQISCVSSLLIIIKNSPASISWVILQSIPPNWASTQTIKFYIYKEKPLDHNHNYIKINDKISFYLDFIHRKEIDIDRQVLVYLEELGVKNIEITLQIFTPMYLHAIIWYENLLPQRSSIWFFQGVMCRAKSSWDWILSVTTMTPIDAICLAY